MKKCLIILAVVLYNFSTSASAINVFPIELPWKNNEDQNAVFNSDDYPGAVYVLEFFGLNCRYCNDNVPNVKQLAQKYASNTAVKVLDVGVDSSDSNYVRWIAKHNPSYPVLKDGNRSIYSQLNTEGIPTTAVVNCQGEVIYVTVGVWSQSTVQRIEAAIAQALAAEGCGVQ